MSLKMLGLSADGRLAVPQGTGDVKSWDTYFAPDDDIHGVIVAGLTQAAQKGAEDWNLEESPSDTPHKGHRGSVRGWNWLDCDGQFQFECIR